MKLHALLLPVVVTLGIVLLACGGSDDGGSPTFDSPVTENRGTVELTWWGQAMFVLTTADGTRVLLDPYGEIGYRVPTAEELAADVVTVSHDHPDHSNVTLAGEATVLRGLTADGWASNDETFSDTRIFSIDAFHDDSEGSERGRNAMFVIETAGLRIAHLGDIGQAELTLEQLDALGQIDVLLIPVGGVFTVDAAGATDIVGQIGPRIVVPMHYGTAVLAFDLDPVEAFLEGKDVREIASSTVGFDVDALPEPGAAEIWVLEPAGG
ncbi:MAG: MBL fold metallo-hydrolase [Chloroflexi bacterium]|nr:MBL fold metallo-hydrolase [Chloroflexota bacterium]